MPEKSTAHLRILISPLNWGLGHASRLIPLVRSYRSRGYEIVLGGNGFSIDLLKREFPDLEVVSIPFTEIRYGAGHKQIFNFILGIWKYFFAVIKEHRRVKAIIREKNIDLVISDNRLGLFSKKAKTIILTHQIWLSMPRGWEWLGIFANMFNHYLIRKFDECWVVDSDKSPDLAGELSHPPIAGIPIRYIGPVSRFAGKKPASIAKVDVLVILGGPEPQRSMLEEILISQLTETEFKAVIAGGTPKIRSVPTKSNIEYISYADGNHLMELIQNAEIIICRSGYSSIMDLVALHRSAILIPTPGQPEQEYLGEYLSGKRYFLNYRQPEFNLMTAIDEWKKFKPKIPDFTFNEFPK